MFIMRESGGIAIMSLLLMSLSASIAQTSEGEETCERVLVKVEEADFEVHSGIFYPVGTDEDGKPMYMTEGGYVLQYMFDDDEYTTYEAPLTPAQVAAEPLDDDEDLESLDPRVDLRFLQSDQLCGYWVIGMETEGDIPMYPMIKVADCADEPTAIDGDSVWYHQDCHTCAQEAVGTVALTSEPWACGSFGSPTPAPVDEDHTGHDHDDEDGTGTTVTAGGAKTFAGHGVGLGVAVAALGVAAASFFANTI